jgi:hypothetical protein
MAPWHSSGVLTAVVSVAIGLITTSSPVRSQSPSAPRAGRRSSCWAPAIRPPILTARVPRRPSSSMGQPTWWTLGQGSCAARNRRPSTKVFPLRGDGRACGTGRRWSRFGCLLKRGPLREITRLSSARVVAKRADGEARTRGGLGGRADRRNACDCRVQRARGRFTAASAQCTIGRPAAGARKYGMFVPFSDPM